MGSICPEFGATVGTILMVILKQIKGTRLLLYFQLTVNFKEDSEREIKMVTIENGKYHI